MKEHSKYFPDSFYRLTIKGLCVRNGRVLLSLECKDLGSTWEIPGGGLDFGEDLRLGFKREIEEEMGLKITKMSDKPIYIWTHRYEANHRKIGWYYSLVLAYRIEFENLDFKRSDECEEIRFFAKDELNKDMLSGQTKKLSDIFNPDDFKDPF